MAKKKPNTSSEEEQAVLNYLRKVNRPYSSTDIFNNLHAKYPKAAVAKSLEKLVSQSLIVSKVYGKSAVYAPKQTEEAATADDLESLDTDLQSLTEKVDKLKAENKQLSQAVSQLQSTPTTENAQTDLERILQENEAFQERLRNLQQGKSRISDKDHAAITAEMDKCRNEWRKRRRMFQDMFKTVTEHMPGDPNELKEDMGIEDDVVPFDQDPLAL
ncbi:Tat binding protein 1-interacting protein-domain-containing protein [Radiomyces spectabilis]|uniref:Tat binding protein 1-interacting protein-domain-containing protein n=1 Tax=Radiomyces spectabilis TaxID=64574 RepID=UPI00221FF6D4|nr:Tat binding protein 1-interacting protein-domain-containing protein [Radiomyces spectabilis]KAI8385013.1 Tat binding protein 1-interacting protein-domain-containing protein [Radiomyces spectabilis]